MAEAYMRALFGVLQGRRPARCYRRAPHRPWRGFAADEPGSHNVKLPGNPDCRLKSNNRGITGVNHGYHRGRRNSPLKKNARRVQQRLPRHANDLVVTEDADFEMVMTAPVMTVKCGTNDDPKFGRSFLPLAFAAPDIDAGADR